MVMVGVVGMVDVVDGVVVSAVDVVDEVMVGEGRYPPLFPDGATIGGEVTDEPLGRY